MAALTAGVSWPGVGPVSADTCRPASVDSVAASACDELTRATGERLADDEELSRLVTRTAQRLGLTGLNGRVPDGSAPTDSAITGSPARDHEDGGEGRTGGKGGKGGKGNGKGKGRGEGKAATGGKGSAQTGETQTGEAQTGAAEAGEGGTAVDSHVPAKPAVPNPAGLPDVSTVSPAPDLPGLPVLPVVPSGMSFGGVPVAGAASSARRPADSTAHRPVSPDRRRIAPRTYQKGETLPDVPSVPGLPQPPALDAVDGVLPGLGLD
ncbi:hypothetical protein ACWGH8_28730 [Nonomuraea muscovyensis]